MLVQGDREIDEELAVSRERLTRSRSGRAVLHQFQSLLRVMPVRKAVGRLRPPCSPAKERFGLLAAAEQRQHRQSVAGRLLAEGHVSECVLHSTPS